MVHHEHSIMKMDENGWTWWNMNIWFIEPSNRWGLNYIFTNEYSIFGLFQAKAYPFLRKMMINHWILGFHLMCIAIFLGCETRVSDWTDLSIRVVHFHWKMYFNPLRDHCVVVETINKPFGNEEFYHLYRRFLAVHFVIVVIASESSTVGSLLKVQLSSVINNHRNI